MSKSFLTLFFMCIYSLLIHNSIISAQEILNKNQNRPKLHLLIVADTSDPKIGKSVKVDEHNISQLFKDGFKTSPDRLMMEIINGAEVTKKNIEDYCKKVVVNENDTVLFYFSGHGYSKGEDHFLKMRAGPDLMRKDLKTLLAGNKTNPRLRVILTDCCSKEIPPKANLAPFANPKAEWPMINNLFFQFKGEIDINGCQKNAFSWCFKDSNGSDLGGTFTIALVRLLCTRLENEATVEWTRFGEELTDLTNYYFHQLPMQDNPQKNQYPEIVIRTNRANQVIDKNRWLLGIESNTATLEKKPITIITKLYPNTPAAEAGLQEKMILRKVDGKEVHSPLEFNALLQASKNGQVIITIEKDAQSRDITIHLQSTK